MGRGKTEVEVEKPLTNVHTEQEIAEGKNPPKDLPQDPGPSLADLLARLEHLSNHLAEYQSVVMGLEERVTDLETLLAAPKDAVQFTAPPAEPVWSNDRGQHPGNQGDVPWYQPDY